ncbi:MAG: amidohydrolase family protein [Verrucomicrobia bacterium]|nr:amidohydrolase family protein [Verrucomicrobiota bacterium]
MELIDTHVHLLHPERFTYAWCAGSAILDRGYRLGDYQAAVAPAPGVRVASLLFMEGDVPAAQQEAEAGHFARLASGRGPAPAVAAVIAGAWPEAGDFPERLEHYAREPRIRGLRRVLHTQPDDLCTTPEFAANLRRLPAFGLPFDLCLRPRLLRAAAELAERCPETVLVLDHGGVPDLAGGHLAVWREGIRLIAARPNVVCKFSGLASLCDARKPLTAQVRPCFDLLLESFGPGRMMWGSDWPLCNLTFGMVPWLETTAELLSRLPPAEREAIATGTARRVYRL